MKRESYEEARLPLSRPWFGEEEIEAVAEVLRSGWITSGPRVAAFEEAFRTYTGAREAVALSSCTAAFHLLFEALEIGPGDEVVLPSLTWPSAANMAVHAGARPVFADIDPVTWNIDPGALEAAVTPRTRVVIPVHFAGLPCDIERLAALCARTGAVLVEDAAHAAGAELRGRRIGGAPAQGSRHAAAFSFHAVKNLTTAEGGMVTTADAELAARLRRLRFHGIEHDAWKRYGSRSPSGYDIREPGWKYNLTDIQAALGIVQLRRLDEAIERRRGLAEHYERALASVEELRRPGRPDYPYRHAWHIYAVSLDRRRAGIDRDTFRARLSERGIGTGLHFLAVHRLSFYREKYPGPFDLAVTEDVCEGIVSLPLFPAMSPQDVERVAGAVKDVLALARKG